MSGTNINLEHDYDGINVLVTGADGFIGSHLVETLVARGANVTALAMYNSFDAHGWLDDISPGVRQAIQMIRGDIRDTSFMRRIIARQDIVFHLAALIAIPHSYSSPQSYVETNILGTLNVLEGARASSVQRVIHTSTSEVYGTAQTMPITEAHPLQGQSPYSASKIGADMIATSFALSFNLPVAIIRPFNTFGPRQSERAIIPTVLRQALDERVDIIKVGDVTPIRDFTYVNDTVAAFMAIGQSPNVEYGRPYNAGAGYAVTISQMIDIALELIDCQKPVMPDPSRARPVHSEVRALQADATLFSGATGWRAQTSLKAGLQKTIDWWRDRIALGRVREDAGYST